MKSLKTILLTDDPEVSGYADSCGVSFIMLDLEINGKSQRQSIKDTIISSHRIENILAVKESLIVAKLIVRVNPLSEYSAVEFDRILNYGCSYIMLPMFNDLMDIERALNLIKGRAELIPLFETKESLNNIEHILNNHKFKFIHFGLNDLSIQFNKKFLFQVVSEGFLDAAIQVCHKKQQPFGFGGTARMDDGRLKGKHVVAKHCFYGSEFIILSRAFHNASITISDFKNNCNLASEIQKLDETVAFYDLNLSERNSACEIFDITCSKF